MTYRPLPEGTTIKESLLHGLGLYSTKSIRDIEAGVMMIQTTKDILPGEELTLKYNLYAIE